MIDVFGEDVMQIAHHYFENGIAYFTRRINRCISMGGLLASNDNKDDG